MKTLSSGALLVLTVVLTRCGGSSSATGLDGGAPGRPDANPHDAATPGPATCSTASDCSASGSLCCILPSSGTANGRCMGAAACESAGGGELCGVEAPCGGGATCGEESCVQPSVLICSGSRFCPGGSVHDASTQSAEDAARDSAPVRDGGSSGVDAMGDSAGPREGGSDVGDGAVRPSADGASERDSGKVDSEPPCGGGGQVCCGGSTQCVSGYVCDNGVCRVPAACEPDNGAGYGTSACGTGCCAGLTCSPGEAGFYFCVGD